MKFQKILLSASLALGTVLSQNVDYTYNTDAFKYNFKCLEDNKGICKFLEKELLNAVNAMTKIMKFEKPVKFEAFVDDLSKHRIITSKEVVAAVLDKQFVPLSSRDTNIVSPYPNSKIISENISEENEDLFYVVLNNFKSNENFLNSLTDDFDSYIIMEIMEELQAIELLKCPFGCSIEYPDEEFHRKFYMVKRKDLARMEATAQSVTDFCKDKINIEKTHEIIHWEDTLISKESISKKVRRSVKKVVKCLVKGKDHNKEDEKEKNNGFKRLVALGDIHGDHEHLISILRHAKLIDEENNWIGTDSILVQMGDIIDRGSETLKAYNTLLDLREQAKKKGGEVNIILGNHEILALQGNHLYTSLGDFNSFGGVEALEEAFNPDAKIGKFVRQEMNITMIIADSLFVHGGITPEHIPDGIEKLNQVTREILLDTPTVDELYELYLNNVSHPIFANKIFDTGSGPICSKTFSNGDEREICSQLEETLRLTNTKRMIVGHTVQPYGKIRTKCNNKFIAIDIGISRCIGGGYYGYLEMLFDKNEIWARYFKK